MLGRVIFALVAALCLSGAAAAQPAAPPLSAYGSLPAVEAVSLSPSGERIAYIAVEGERRLLVARDLRGGQLAALDVGRSKVRDLGFLGENRLRFSTSVTGRPQIPGWRLPRSEWLKGFSYDLRTGKLTPLLGGTADALDIIVGDVESYEDQGDGYIITRGITLTGPCARKDLFRVDPRTGVGRIEEEGVSCRSTEWVTDETGRAIARSHYGDRRGDWSLDMKTPAGWRGIDFASAKLDVPSLMGLGRKPRWVLVSREVDGERTLSELSLDTVQEVEIPDSLEADYLLFNRQSGLLEGLSYQGDDRKHVFYDPEKAAIWSKVTRAFKGKLVDAETWANDFRRVVLKVQGDEEPSSFYVLDTQTLQAQYFADAYPGVPPEAVAAVRPVRYKASDGLEISGYLTLPPGREPKGLPLLVLPHGGPQSKDVRGFDWWAQAFASRGYAVLQPNFRGSSNRGLAFVRAGHGEWGRKMQTDLSDGVRHLAAEGVIDPKRVCIMGGSYGGYAALAGAAIDTGVYRCAVSVNGVSDLPMMLQQESRDAGDQSIELRYWRRFMGVDQRGKASLDEISPARRAEAVTIPVLLIHGRDDTVVPFAQSRRMHEALIKAGKISTLLTLDGEDHWLSRGDTRLRMLEAAVAFVEQHNPAG
jgi:dipeptidyl aminopeptidase/acylaminoacyl peptidase